MYLCSRILKAVVGHMTGDINKLCLFRINIVPTSGFCTMNDHQEKNDVFYANKSTENKIAPSRFPFEMQFIRLTVTYPAYDYILLFHYLSAKSVSLCS